jgi:outer membrane protein
MKDLSCRLIGDFYMEPARKIKSRGSAGCCRAIDSQAQPLIYLKQAAAGRQVNPSSCCSARSAPTAPSLISCGISPQTDLKKTNHEKQGIAAALFTLFSAAALAQEAAPGPWLIRGRAVQLNSANGDTTGLGLSINNKTLPEVDISYFFSPNIALELVLTVPQRQTLSSRGTAIGSFSHLPPSLTAQYHFPQAGFTPYLGAGVNYTRLSAVSMPAGVDIKRSSFGPVLQAGVDIPVGKNLYLNFDLKKEYIRTTVMAAPASATSGLIPCCSGLGSAGASEPIRRIPRPPLKIAAVRQRFLPGRTGQAKAGTASEHETPPQPCIRLAGRASGLTTSPVIGL